MFKKTLLLAAIVAAVAVAVAQADTTATRAPSLVVERDLLQPDMVTYNGHAGLGVSVYQHNSILMADMGGQFS